MITKEQVASLAKKKKTNETTVFREYLQVLFLSKLYSQTKSNKVFFKGGTALHLLFGASRFSEDLDFTVELKQKEFSALVKKVFTQLQKEGLLEFKEKKSLAGKRFLLTALPDVLPYRTFVNLDFSFREKVFTPQKSILETDYPILFTSYVHHLSQDEIFAEKIRALLTRSKGRDLYDLWFLLSQGAELDKKLVKEKLKYYGLQYIKKQEILSKIEDFSKKDFILDVRPFVTMDERNKLGKFFDYIKDYLKTKL